MKSFVIILALASCCLAAAVPDYANATPELVEEISAVPWEESLPRSSGDAFADELHARIVSGHAATTNQFPYQVSVRGRGICGGSILSAAWVLSAAHCTVNQNQFTLRFGSLNLVAGGIAQTATVVVNHPNYNPFNLNNDISLIRIPSPLTFSPAIRAIRLPSRSQASNLFVGQLVTVSGWGATVQGGGAQTLLRWVNLRVITNAQCQQTFPSGGVIIPSVICTTGTGGLQSPCGGDSGGPLVINENGTPTQVGIVAFGAPEHLGGCSVGHPGGFTRTSSFLTWVNQHTGIPVRA